MKNAAIAVILAVLISTFVIWEVLAVASIRFYILPVETVGTHRGPQHLPWRFDADPENSITTIQWSCKDNGLNPTMLCAVNAEDTEHAILEAFPDVFGDIPVDLDQAPSAQSLSDYETFVETVAAVPGQWNPATPWREILRQTFGQFAFSQRYHAITGEAVEDSGVNLNTQLQNMPQYVQDAIEQIALEFGYNWAADISPTDNARKILKWFQEQWGTEPVLFGFTTL